LEFVSKFSLATFKVEKNNKETNNTKGSEYQLQCQTLSMSVTRYSAQRQDQHALERTYLKQHRTNQQNLESGLFFILGEDRNLHPNR
jgi:hypothetical protein